MRLYVIQRDYSGDYWSGNKGLFVPQIGQGAKFLSKELADKAAKDAGTHNSQAMNVVEIREGA